MFCKNCGSLIGENNVFCTVCGTRVDAETQNERASQPNTGAGQQLVFWLHLEDLEISFTRILQVRNLILNMLQRITQRMQ